MMLMPLVCLAQQQMEISGKLELSDDHFVLVLKNPISIEQHGDVVSSRRVQVAGITVSHYETLKSQIGHTIDLMGKVHHAYHSSHKEKLVIHTKIEISGKLELSDDHFVLVLKDPISVDHDGDTVSSRRVQVVDITVSQYETLSNQIGHTVDLSGEVYHAYHEDHKEKLVIDPDSISEGRGTNDRIYVQRTDATNNTDSWWYKFWYSLTILNPDPVDEDLIGTWQGPGVDATGTIRVDRDKWSVTLGQNGRAEIIRGYTYARPTHEDRNSIMNDGDMLRALGYRLANALNSWFADALSGGDATQRIKATWSLEKGTESPDNCVMCHANKQNNIPRRSKGEDYCDFIRLDKNGRVMFRWHLEKLTSNSLIVNTSNPHYYISLKKVE